MKNSITQTISRARRKLQLERLVKGAAILIAFLLVGSFLSTFLMARYNFSDDALWWSRLVGILGSLLLFGYYIFRPLWYSPSTGQVARFLEERYPQLEERVSTAVELKNTASKVHPELQRLIRGDARKQLAKISQPGLYYRQKSLVSLVALFSSLAIFTLLFLMGPEVYPYSLNKLLLWYDDSQAPIYSIEVTPGNVTVGKRSDQKIRATLKGFDSETAQLMVRYENQPQWEETTMRPDLQGGDFVFIFFDIRDPIDYYVTADGIQSETYTLEVSEIPRVESLTVVLQFPGYTGLENLTLEDEGDIRALVGTQAELFIRVDQPVQAGKINLEQGGEVSLELLAPQELRGVFEISEDDYYRFHLQDQEDFWNPASDEYLIQALEDQPPILSFIRPGRDQKVTNIEEIFAQIKAEDDYGIDGLALRFSLNGDPEQEAQLDYPQGSRSFSTSHTFYLEEFNLEPGDFVSYYAEARDSVSTSATDIYFFEVEPFDREYYQSQQSGGAGGGGGQQENIDFAKRQKELIAATFKLERDRERYEESELDEDSQTLALVQQRLQGEVETVIERMERRSAAVTDPRFQKMSEHLKEAITHMEPAHHHLSELQTKEALPEEQKSLQQLLHAEALFKEIQVAFSQNQGGGGASAQDLADLVDLELDRTKNQYETLQQNRETDREQALDEALEKLKELARRQEQLVERHRQQAMQGSSGSNMSQQELIEEAERVARELERLSRQQQDPQLQNISRSLRQAVRDMRQAQSSGENNQEAQMRAQQALERLQEAREGLGQQRREQLADDLEQLKEQSERLVEGQREVLDQVEDLNEAVRSGRLDESSIQQLRSVLRDKTELQEDLQQLEGNLHEGARKMESNQTEASRKLKQAALDIRDQRIPEKMEDGTNLLARGWTDMAQERERGIMGDLEQLANMIREAERALGSGTEETPRERLQRALNQVGSLVENLESLEDRASGNGQESQDQEQQQGQQEGQQPGEQPGQQGQQPGEQQGQQGSESAQGGQSPSGVSRQAGRNPNATGVDPRQVGREWRERLQDAEDLRGLMEGRPELGRDVASMIRRMRQLDAERLFTDAEELAHLKSQVIDGFRQLELEINRTLDEEVENLLRLVDRDEVPPEFRQRVEEYYRSLANRRDPD